MRYECLTICLYEAFIFVHCERISRNWLDKKPGLYIPPCALADNSNGPSFTQIFASDEQPTVVRCFSLRTIRSFCLIALEFRYSPHSAAVFCIGWVVYSINFVSIEGNSSPLPFVHKEKLQVYLQTSVVVGYPSRWTGAGSVPWVLGSKTRIVYHSSVSTMKLKGCISRFNLASQFSKRFKWKDGKFLKLF